MIKLADSEIAKALYIIKQARASSIINNVDPRAFRIALKFGLLVDDHFSKIRLTPKEDAELDIKAQILFQKSMGIKEEENKKPIQELETVIWVPMLKSLIKSKGNCPCYPENGKCPCKEFIQNFKCRCGLFIIKKIHRY